MMPDLLQAHRQATDRFHEAQLELDSTRVEQERDLAERSM